MNEAAAPRRLGFGADLVRAVRAFPALLRIGVAEVVAYRAEFLVWILTTNMPLVMLALWHAVAADGPVGRFGQREFTTYFLGVLTIRLLTSNWVAWQLSMEIRDGTLSGKLLRPIHPLFAYGARTRADERQARYISHATCMRSAWSCVNSNMHASSV